MTTDAIKAQEDGPPLTMHGKYHIEDIFQSSSLRGRGFLTDYIYKLEIKSARNEVES